MKTFLRVSIFFKAVRPDDNCTLKSEEGLVHDRNLVYPFSVDKKEFVIFELASNTKSTRSSIETQRNKGQTEADIQASMVTTIGII